MKKSDEKSGGAGSLHQHTNNFPDYNALQKFSSNFPHKNHIKLGSTYNLESTAEYWDPGDCVKPSLC